MYFGVYSLLFGLLSRIFIPWLAKRQKDPISAKWSWKYVLPQIVSFLLVVLLLPLLINDLQLILDVSVQEGWLIGWGVGDIGRKTYKALAESDQEGS